MNPVNTGLIKGGFPGYFLMSQIISLKLFKKYLEANYIESLYSFNFRKMNQKCLL